MRGALDDLLIVDFSRAIAGPWATMLLAEMGAQVVKIEQPGSGDEVRGWPPFIGPESNYFFANNRSKRSLALDLKHEEGRAIAFELCRRADVVVENFTPGVIDRLGLGYDEVTAANPSVIYTSVSGFGQTGPYRNRKGYDPIVQAMGGIMSVTGEEDGLPCKTGIPIGDLGAALFAGQAILAALFHRERTGEGQCIDVSMLDGQVSLLTVQAAIYLADGTIPRALGRSHPGRVPSTVFTTKDVKHVHLVANDNQWPRFCAQLGVPELGTDERFRRARDRVDHRDEIMPALIAAVGSLTRAEIEQRLNSEGIPCGPVNTIDEVIEDPHVQARGMIQSFDHPAVGTVRALGWPFKFSGLDIGITAPPPMLGEHSGPILSELLDLSDVEIARLHELGVIETTGV